VQWAQSIRERRLSEIVRKLRNGDHLRGRVVSRYPDGWALLTVRGYRVLVETTVALERNATVEIFVQGSALLVKRIRHPADNKESRSRAGRELFSSETTEKAPC
jgi:hypothetical protein